MKHTWLLGLASLALTQAAHAQTSDAWNRVKQTGELRWGADATGGAPYVFPDPQNPSRLIGFEVDLMARLAVHLGVKPRLVLVQWDELVPALERDDFDMAFNGLEITPEREQVILFTRPYYIFSEQITVRKGETRFHKLTDLHGFKVGTLSASLALNLLTQDGHITPVPYPSPVEAYKDLEIGRTDAVLMDVPIAAFYALPNPKLENAGKPVGEGLYAGGIRMDSPELKRRLDQALGRMIADGELQQVYEKWNMWNEKQKFLDVIPAGRKPGSSGVNSKPLDPGLQSAGATSIKKYVPLLLKAACVTIVLSFLAMGLAVAAGFLLCLGKLYGSWAIHKFCSGYIEVIRGTPLLIQLYLLYYGLPNLGIQLNAFVAGVLGMGLNYAAYEAEIYRAGILSVAKGQDEAARSLGMTRRQSLRYVIVPQAFRTILPPSTNDFIALFKDTSLVSVITVTELTRAYDMAATATYRFLQLGLLTALLYFLMSYPLSLWARALERKRHAALH